jgi:hypothetical protein
MHDHLMTKGNTVYTALNWAIFGVVTWLSRHRIVDFIVSNVNVKMSVQQKYVSFVHQKRLTHVKLSKCVVGSNKRRLVELS